LKPEEITVTKLVAALLFMIMSVFIWFPIAYIFGMINLKLTIIIALMAFIRETCKIYLGLRLKWYQ